MVMVAGSPLSHVVGPNSWGMVPSLHSCVVCHKNPLVRTVRSTKLNAASMSVNKFVDLRICVLTLAAQKRD